MSKFKWYSEGRQGSVWADSLDEAMSIVKSSYPDLDQMVFVVPRVDSPVKVIIESGKENRLARIEFLTDTYGNAAGSDMSDIQSQAFVVQMVDELIAAGALELQ